MKQITLRPSDVVVVCQLTITSDASFQALAASIGLSVGECHNAVRRLGLASLLNPVSRRPAGELLARFLVHGVPYAFPAQVGAAAVGVATGASSLVPGSQPSSLEAYVWPDLDGTAQGMALTPLFPNATSLPARNSALYEILALIDALRIGHAREKKVAEDLLRERLSKGDG